MRLDDFNVSSIKTANKWERRGTALTAWNTLSLCFPVDIFLPCEQRFFRVTCNCPSQLRLLGTTMHDPGQKPKLICLVKLLSKTTVLCPRTNTNHGNVSLLHPETLTGTHWPGVRPVDTGLIECRILLTGSRQWFFLLCRTCVED